MTEIKSLVLTFLLVIIILTPSSMAQQDTDVSVSVDRACQTGVYDFHINGAAYSEDLNTQLVGLNSTTNFEYMPVNQGEMSFSNFNLSIYNTADINVTSIEDDGNETEEDDDNDGNETETTTADDINIQTTDEENRTLMNTSIQSSNYTKNYLFNSTNSNTDQSVTELFHEYDESEPLKHYVRPYRHNTTEDIRDLHSNKSLIGYDRSWEPMITVPRMPEFFAEYPPGEYEAELDVEYRCEFRPRDQSTFNVDGESYNITEFEELDESSYSVLEDVKVDGLNVSEVRTESDRYAVTPPENSLFIEDFVILDSEGEGVIPDAVGEDDEVDQNVDTDAQEPDEAETDFDVDANETLEDADEREGQDEEFPGETEVEVPEPEPEPEPTPSFMLSLNIKPLNTTYEAPRGRFTELGLEIENVGEETVNDIELEPRFSEGMDWESQIGNIDSLDVGESVNRSVFVEPGEDVSPGTYQLPIYASNPEHDIDMQYVNVEVLQQVFRGVLNIQEAPRDVRFEQSQNYTVPVLLENQGEDSLESVEVEIDNVEACGEYSAEVVDSIDPGESESVSIEFMTGEDLEECSGTIVASTDDGDFAFSEFNVDVREEIGIVPEEFRVPIVASLWTIMLLAYAVLTKKYGVHNMTVKVPLVLLVVGEAFIIIYLSSVYYNVMPPGLLPF